MKKLVYTLIPLLLLGCIKEDQFGKSSFAIIKTFTLPGQNGSTNIDNENLTINIPVMDTIVDLNLVPIELTISNFASISPSATSSQNFQSPVEYTITAEDGTIQVYTVTVQKTGNVPQVDNSSFEDWYIETVGSGNVNQPGKDKTSTLWATANRGLALGGASENTSPQQKSADSLYAKLETVTAPAIVRIAAATLFTGKFTEGFPSINDPRSNLTLGVPFTGRPQTMRFQYKYVPGSSNEDSNGDPLTYGDQCDIYMFLENRDGSKTKRVGTAWFRNGDTQSSWKNIEIPVKYGPLDASDPWYSYAQPQPDEEWGTGSESITHITVLFSSSFEGDFFSGAIGSTLEVDNLEMVY
jgi:hypothetical protein